MTDRVATISRDGTGTTRFIIDLLHRFKDIANRKRKFIVLALTLAVAGAFIIVARVSGHDGQPSDSSNGNSASSDQQSGQADSDKQTQSSNDNSSNSKTSGSSATNSSSTSVTVNGQSVNAPQNGDYDKTVDVPSGQVRVSGNSSSSTSGGSATNDSSTNVEVNSN